MFRCNGKALAELRKLSLNLKSVTTLKMFIIGSNVGYIMNHGQCYVKRNFARKMNGYEPNWSERNEV